MDAGKQSLVGGLGDGAASDELCFGRQKLARRVHETTADCDFALRRGADPDASGDCGSIFRGCS